MKVMIEGTSRQLRAFLQDPIQERTDLSAALLEAKEIIAEYKEIILDNNDEILALHQANEDFGNALAEERKRCEELDKLMSQASQGVGAYVLREREMKATIEALRAKLSILTRDNSNGDPEA